MKKFFVFSLAFLFTISPVTPETFACNKISIILSKCSRDEEQRDLMLYKMDSINSILSNSTESIQIQFDDFNDIGKHVTKQNDSIIHIEEKQTKILRQIDKNVKNIDNNN